MLDTKNRTPIKYCVSDTVSLCIHNFDNDKCGSSLMHAYTDTKCSGYHVDPWLC